MPPIHRPSLLLRELSFLLPRPVPCPASGSKQFHTSPMSSSALSAMSIPISKQKYVPKTGSYPRDFIVSGTHIGVKASTPSTTPDLALICSKSPCVASAVFTTNQFQAAPVVVSRQTLKTRHGAGIQAIIINSGCANAVTGSGGMEDALAMAAETDRCLGSASTEPSKTLVMSTGVIGQRLPIRKILNGIPLAHCNLSSTHEAWLSTATAICTTDTFPKLLSTTFTLPSHPSTTYALAGMTKGAGMIHPNMATLLAILCTDVPLSPSACESLLTHATAQSFNSISVDGDTSTNDTVALLANGAASPSPSTHTIDSPSHPDYSAMGSVLTAFAQKLSHLVVRDGEGATKFVTIRVTHAPSYDVAKRVASSVATSPLVKTALYGKDANWGRILCAVGYTPGLPSDSVRPDETSVSFIPTGTESTQHELRLLVNGEPELVDEDRAATMLAEEDLEIGIRLRKDETAPDGNPWHEATVWTCDFSHEYVTINGDYRT